MSFLCLIKMIGFISPRVARVFIQFTLNFSPKPIIIRRWEVLASYSSKQQKSFPLLNYWTKTLIFTSMHVFFYSSMKLVAFVHVNSFLILQNWLTTLENWSDVRPRYNLKEALNFWKFEALFVTFCGGFHREGFLAVNTEKRTKVER